MSTMTTSDRHGTDGTLEMMPTAFRTPAATRRVVRRTLLILLVLIGAVTTALVPASAEGNEAPSAPRAARAIAAGTEHTCALRDNGVVRCWGSGTIGQLGLGTDSTSWSPRGSSPVALGEGRTATAVTAGDSHTCALLDDASVKCWGNGADGRLGQGNTDSLGDEPEEMGDDLPPIDLGAGRTAIAISAGAAHTCAVLDNGAAKCWGNGADGRLGQGSTDSLGDEPGEMGDDLPPIDLGPERTATAISAGTAHTCALLDKGGVKCWGSGLDGRLGSGAVTTRGDGPGEMGAAMPEVSLGAGRTATAISAGAEHTCAILDNGTAKCWGNGADGRLGNGAPNDIGDGPGEMGNALLPIDLGTQRTAIAISAGGQHTCTVTDKHTVACWGLGANGRLGQGDTATRGDTPGELGDSLPPVSLGTGRSATAVTTGADHTCAVIDDGAVACWGVGDSGRLGIDDVDDRGDTPDEMGNNLTRTQLPGTVAAANVRVDLTATPTAVTVGSPITYTATITNTGHQTLRTLALVPPTSATCTTIPTTLAVGASVTVTCTAVTNGADIPQVTRNLGVTTTNTRLGEAVTGTSNTVTTIVTAPSTTRRPDALVRVGKKPFVGNDVYNRTGKKQTVNAATAKKPVRYTVRVQNDGNVTDTLRVKGTRSSKTFTVTYKAGKKNITKKATKGTYRVRNLAPGASRLITVTVTPKKTAKVGAKTPTKVTVTSTTDTTTTDTVKMTTRRR